MGELKIDQNLLDEIAHRLDLRAPNMRAVETVALRTSDHYDVEENTDSFECIVDSATGVGKTYVMAGLIEYFAGIDEPARNFLLLAPGRTIRDKSIKNFTPGNRKSLTSAMKSRPYVIDKDNFMTAATARTMKDPALTKLYVFTVQALTTSTGEGRATHDFQETLGGSFFEFLSKLDDLVILADEHHCYQGPAFTKTIKRLCPELIVGLTATPSKADSSLVAYRYPLAAAIADKVVKTPILVGRKDDRNDVETKLLDGVTLLRYKQQALDSYCDENGLETVNPVMFVIASNIEEATEFQTILDAADFDGGAWVNRTLLVHSALTGDEKEDALAALDAVEDPESPVRIIINVGMLKEGWDVKNVYVIASMRASVSTVLTEQTLGRGMRLPFGQYTGIELLDTVEVLAHEKYAVLIEKRKSLNEAFIDYSTFAATRTTPSGKTVVTQVTTETEHSVLGDTDEAQPGQAAETSPADEATGIVDLDARTQQAEAIAKQTSKKIPYAPIPDRTPIIVPRITSIATAASVSLNDIDLDKYSAFDQLGKTLTSDFSDELRRTKITGKVKGNQAFTETEAATEVLHAALALDIPLSASKESLLRYVMAVPGVQARPLEVGAAQRIVDRVISAMGDDAAVCLSAYGSRCGQRLAAAVQSALKETSQAQVAYEDTVEFVSINKVREVNKMAVAGHADGAFDKSIAFNGWEKNLYTHAWFDTKPEYVAANAMDDGSSVVVWARLHRNDVTIRWTAGGREYNPDFVVFEDEDEGDKRIGWLVETKGDNTVETADVIEKRKAARKWANVVNASPDVDVEWRYLLLSEKDVYDAEGSWEFMKGFGS